MNEAWLDQANAADLIGLAQALEDGRIAAPLSAGAVQMAGFPAAAAAFLSSLSGTSPAVIAAMLRRLALERRRADDRFARVAQLVWSGAREEEQALRDTRVVLDRLFRRAERQVLISTYVIYNGPVVFAGLVERLRERPEIEVEIYVNLPDEVVDERTYLEGFARDHWPSDVPLPALFYDPAVRKQGDKRVKLHAKCVVVDERWAFITSANFTEAAQERNIEAGTGSIPSRVLAKRRSPS
jgi:phosphatidylserine/phosphatidylglycerophosphate/cardiolipin synthase-like enzyme